MNSRISFYNREYTIKLLFSQNRFFMRSGKELQEKKIEKMLHPIMHYSPKHLVHELYLCLKITTKEMSVTICLEKLWDTLCLVVKYYCCKTYLSLRTVSIFSTFYLLGPF